MNRQRQIIKKNRDSKNPHKEAGNANRYATQQFESGENRRALTKHK
jgi:hypothetical protein